MAEPTPFAIRKAHEIAAAIRSMIHATHCKNRIVQMRGACDEGCKAGRITMAIAVGLDEFAGDPKGENKPRVDG